MRLLLASMEGTALGLDARMLEEEEEDDDVEDEVEEDVSEAVVAAEASPVSVRGDDAGREDGRRAGESLFRFVDVVEG